MRLLFYVEPLFELDRPSLKLNWASDIALLIAEVLRAVEETLEVHLVVNDAIAGQLRPPGNVRVCTIPHGVLRDAFGVNDSVEILKAWLLGRYSQQQRLAYGETIRARIGSFEPEVIVSWTPVPFLQALYPRAKVLHTEFALFSHVPFPKSYFFDPIGPGGTAFLNRFWREIDGSLSVNNADLAEIREFKAYCRRSLGDTSPFRSEIEAARKRFRKLLLCPLQFQGHFLIETYSRFRSQFELLLYVLDHVPKDVGVIVTGHPLGTVLPSEAIEYVQQSYPNALFLSGGEGLRTPSQYILPDVDGVVTATSKIGFHTLLFDKKLIDGGLGFFRFMADGESVRDIAATLETACRNKDKLLWWLATHFAVPRTQLTNGEWLARFLHRCQRHEPGPTFYEAFGSSKQVIGSLRLALDKEIRWEWSRQALDKFIALANRGEYTGAVDSPGHGIADLFAKRVLAGEATLSEFVTDYPENLYSALYCRGIVMLNHEARFSEARLYFRNLFRLLMAATEEHSSQSEAFRITAWYSKLCEGLACRYAGLNDEAGAIREAILQAGDAPAALRPPADVTKRGTTELAIEEG